eukprot:TRINITY_DN6659_c0_g1_i8.p1 TRINITY_DN6659_c0_g1~~TRINITY_DN6659_c0_g1_i8.p1  ORF type:complete len:551 (-),score=67.16 TRINITY_DN6659_c0_g1_i8:216-1868(-)
MVLLKTFLLLLAPTLLHAIQLDDFNGPSFPDQYYVEYTYSLPYTSSIQNDVLTYNVQVWYDLPNLRMRIDYSYGIDSVIYVDNTSYSIFPVDFDEYCYVETMDVDSMYKTIRGSHFLPNVSAWNLTESTFIYDPLANRTLRKYVYEYQILEKLNHYTIYTSEDGTIPVQAEMLGTSYIDGSHYDKYEQIFVNYVPGEPKKDYFRLLDTCKQENGGLIDNTGFTSNLATRMAKITSLPIPLKKHIITNKKLIDDYNANTTTSHTLKPNRFLSWNDEDFSQIMLPNTHLDIDLDEFLESPHQIDFDDLVNDDDDDLPASWDWRGTGAVGPVLDQADCGSCWAFSAAETMTSAWFVATGEYIGFSEQQIMDCGWGFGVQGCDGGWPARAIEYVVSIGGIASTTDYQYRGIDEFCKQNQVPFSAKISGYSLIPSRNITMLKQAIKKFGPVSVCIDASPLTFRFHDKGIYRNPQCGWVQEDLDHCVLAIGWGQDNGEEYWIIKNSWSSYWGDEGYIYISMEYDCGVTTMPVIAIVQDTDVDEIEQSLFEQLFSEV